MLETKVVIEALPAAGADGDERRFSSPKGEMTQILNRREEPFRHLVYWDLDSAVSGQERGHHYHARKTENFYVLTGEFDLLLHDLETGVKGAVLVKAGDRLYISPRVAHAFRSRGYAQALEYSPEPYDNSDTLPYQVVV
jgi:mannose-6-phosphate isomerase-like protein (cupin superfamily)